MGAVGGFERNLTLIGMFFFKPIATHGYFLKAIQRLFMAKTDDDDLFGPRKNKKINRKMEAAEKLSKSYNPKKRDEIRKDRHIKFTSKQHFFLYIQTRFSWIKHFTMMFH